jgi:hypothetical protein
MSNERVISFKDFFSIDEKKLKKKEIESLFDINELEKICDLEIDSETLLFESEIKVQDSEFISENLFTQNEIHEENESESFYTLYKDVNENFSCDIFIEGANPDKSTARIIIESKDWNLVFNGHIENGRCVIPIKKLNILEENLTGKIKLEVIAEGNIFVPWEQKFLVQSTKRVSTLNESIRIK